VISEEPDAFIAATFCDNNRELERGIPDLDYLLLEVNTFGSELIQVGLVDALNDAIDNDPALGDLVHC
jgi:hypothetical protein